MRVRIRVSSGIKIFYTVSTGRNGISIFPLVFRYPELFSDMPVIQGVNREIWKNSNGKLV